MKFFLAFLLACGAILVADATPDVPFELARPARDWCLRGADLALPSLPANPGALALGESWELQSSFSSLFGLVQVWGVSLLGRGFSATGILVDGDVLGPDLAYRVWAWKLGVGVRRGSLGLGVQAKILHQEKPKAVWGGALDFGFLWAGPLFAAALAKSVLSAPPYPGETWPPDLALAVAWPWSLPEISGTLGLGILDLFTTPSWAVAGEVDLAVLALRAGLAANTLSFGGGVKLRGVSLDWVFTLHPDLPPSFRVSFGLQWL